jgi:hypothetical protein
VHNEVHFAQPIAVCQQDLTDQVVELLHIVVEGYQTARFVAWKYLVPNPLLPFIWFRVGVPDNHHEIEIQRASEV